jgi:HEAT repeat protein
MAAWALSQISARDQADALSAALRGDQSAQVRETAAWALGEMEARQAEANLGAALADREPDVRATAAWALGQLDLDHAPKPLVDAIKDANDEVRMRAAWALSEIGDPQTVPAVSAALKTETNEKVRQAEIRMLVQSGNPPDEVLKSLLESKDAKTRELAVRALAGRNGPWPWPWPQPRPRPAP